VFEATLDARLIALDAASGTPCNDFGTAGQVSLRDVPGYRAGVYHMTSPPAVVDELRHRRFGHQRQWARG
jgi:quinoprotein glucose dehydrogenase